MLHIRTVIFSDFVLKNIQMQYFIFDELLAVVLVPYIIVLVHEPVYQLCFSSACKSTVPVRYGTGTCTVRIVLALYTFVTNRFFSHLYE